MSEAFGPRETAVVFSRIQGSVTAEGIYMLTFDRPDSSANVFDRVAMEELNRHLDFIERHPELKGVIISSAKPTIFIAGADLNELAERIAAVGELHLLETEPPSPDPLHPRSAEGAAAALHDLITLGQRTFTRVSALPRPVVAAIHGACVGGGYELCLACDYRIASTDRVTRIGLPETKLGILPAWGGSTRLPRLIGLPKALDIILGGKVVTPKAALKFGLVDALVPHEYLLETATKKILHDGRLIKHHVLPFVPQMCNHRPASKAISRWTSHEVLRKTRGHYPAMMEAIQVMEQGLHLPLRDAFALEADAVVRLAKTTVAHNLLRLHFMQERAKKVSPGGRGLELPGLQRAAVVGAGVMGAGIAHWLSSRRVPVILRDIHAEQVAKGMATVEKLYEEGVKRHVLDRTEARAGLDRILPAPTAVPLSHVDLVIEAAVERMDLKQAIFVELAAQTGAGTVLATNTSALSVSAIAAATSAPERVVGLHFFNPVHRMALVEVITGEHTDPYILRRAVRFVQQIGKLPVLVQDRPGFLVNRILMPYLLEAGHLWEAGASVHEIDEAMLAFGMPMGPLRLIDEIGIDVAAHVAETLSSAFPNRMALPQVLYDLLAAGLLGRKSGRGFYRHAGGKSVPNLEINGFRPHRADAPHYTRTEVAERMVLLMVNEAARCLEEDVVATPEDVDLAMVLGTGFAPYLGGPLRYADAISSHEIVEAMSIWVDKGAPHLAPCALLHGMAAKNETFYPKGGTL